MSASKLDLWLKEGRYLPRFMRDFNDQKDLFKAIHQTINVRETDMVKDVSWPIAQVYVIDVFLWWMARRGYTLQPARADQAFVDIHETIRIQNDRRHAAEMAALQDAFQTEPKA